MKFRFFCDKKFEEEHSFVVPTFVVLDQIH